MRKATGKPVEHVEAPTAPSAAGAPEEPMEAAAIALAHDDHDHHGPPPANRSSRVEPQLLGMLLFIISEVMVFGAFFTAYFFIRVVQRATSGRPTGDGAAGRDRGRQHRRSCCRRR